MTRLVGVRAVCDGCSAAAAVVFCVTHRSVLCRSCDAEAHSTPGPAHQRVDLASAVTALPFCEYCDDAPASIYCETEGSTLCDKCDRAIHSSHTQGHYRTPISSTLRNRAVEFRGRSRPKSPKHDPEQLSDAPADERPPVNDTLPNHSLGLSVPRQPTPASITSSLHLQQGQQHHHHRQQQQQRQQHQQQQQQQRLRTPQAPSQEKHKHLPPTLTGQTRSPTTARKRSSKVLAKRKLRREAPRSSPPPPVSRSLADTLGGQANPLDLVDSAAYPTFLFPSSVSSADVKPTSPATPYAAFPPEGPVEGPPYNDPLLIDPNAQLRQEEEARQGGSDEAGDGDGLGPDFSNIVTYGSIDFSADTALEGLNGTGRSVSGSGESSRRKSPDFEALNQEARPIADRLTADSAQTTVAAVAAAAAAAAGEMYLLNSVSSGSLSSRERLTPPLNVVSRVPNPAGVAEAATAAANAAAESVAAAAESGVAAVSLGLSSVPPQGVSSRPSQHTTDAVAQALQPQAGVIGGGEGPVRRLSDPTIRSGMGSGRGVHSFLAQRQIFDDAVRKLDSEAGSRITRNGTKRENSFNGTVQDALANRSDGNADLLVPMGDDVLPGGGDVMVDLEMPRDEFGMFDSIDLSQFEQSGSGSLGFALSDYRSKAADSDEG